MGFLAKLDNKPVSGISFTSFNGYIIEAGIARSKDDLENNLYSMDLLKWNIIEWGIQNNMKFYDLAGFNPNPISKKEIGIAQYKKKWGGKKYDFFYLQLL